MAQKIWFLQKVSDEQVRCILGCPGFSNLQLPFSQSATFHSFSLADSSTRRFAFSCRFVSQMTSCDYLRLVHIYNRYYVFLPTILHFYGNICTRPTSDQFDLKSTTWSQKQKELSTTSNLRLVADGKKNFLRL